LPDRDCWLRDFVAALRSNFAVSVGHEVGA
jgi:hypothetical protein